MEEPPPRCRLCLATFPDSTRLLDIFGEEDFRLMIRDCTGVFLPEQDDNEDSLDSPAAVCLNCAETVRLMDEFRKLCRHSEERLTAGEEGWTDLEDLERWEAYRGHVGELRKLLPVVGFVRPMGFEWADTDDLLEIKQEVDADEDFQDGEVGEDVSERRMVKAEPEVDQLALAKAILKFPEVWNGSHTDFKDASLREQAWNKLTNETGLDKARLKREFKQLRNLRLDKNVSDELHGLLESMFEARDRSKEDKEHSSNERLKLAQVVYDHEAIWSRTHDDYNNASKWTKIAKQLGGTVEELKRQWKALRDVYHARRRRILAGTIDLDSPLLQEPLHILLEKMLAENTNIKAKPPPTWEEAAAMSVDERLKLAELIFEREIIWNRGHAEHNNLVKRDRAFDELAEQMKFSTMELKAEWRKMRNMYRQRTLRVMEGKLEPDSHHLNDPIYLLLKKMLSDNMEVGKRSAILEECEESSSNPQYDRLSLAQAFLKQEVIWNKTHPLNNAPRAREEAFKEIAEQFQMSVAELRNQWKSLRDSYRVRRKRLLANPDDENAIHATLNPVHLLMDQMSNEVQSSPFNREQPEVNPSRIWHKRTNFDANQRLAIANAIHEQELLWNRSHPHHNDQEKREQLWEQIANDLEITMTDLKQHWKLLRDLYRGRFIRAACGKIPPDHPFLRQPLYRLLDQMLRDNMVVGKLSKAKPLKRLRRQQTNDAVEENDDGEEPPHKKPFDDPEQRARLAEEIKQHEFLWNVNHVDYSRGTLRGQVWTEIANQFGLDRAEPIKVWRLATHRHRRLRELYGSVGPVLLEKDPLHRMLHEVVYGGTDAKDCPDDSRAPIWPPKRRYTGKRVYSDEGCIKVIQNGIPHYLKVCELCGKNVERSDFEYHMNKHNGLTPYACSFDGCDKRYGSKITRDRHEVTVHTADAERFECDQCGEKFKYRSKLEYHIAVHHLSQHHPCTVCGKDLKHKHALRRHMQIHIESHPCPICNQVLQKKHSLEVHMRIHTKEKPFPCALCGQRFRIKVLLKTHLRKVHNVALEELEAAGPSGCGN